MTSIDVLTPPQLFNQVVGSVVFINNVDLDGNSWYGGGYIHSNSGLIVSAAHVVFRTNLLNIVTFSGNTYTGQVTKIDEGIDLAAIQINTTDKLIQAKTADLITVKIGEPICAIGHPYRFQWSLTKGIISQIRKEVINHNGRAGPYILKDALQIDCPVNIGNSGGPIFDLQGRVLGTCSMVASRSGDNSGVAFCNSMPNIKKFLLG